MKQLIPMFCLIFGILSEDFAFAAKNKNPSPSRVSQTIESPFVSEEKCIEEINRVRQEHGLKPLKRWDKLSECAREHSENMAAERCAFGHDGFDQRAAHMWEQANLASFGENVAYSHHYENPVDVAVDGWMKSPGHKKNILGKYEETGVGVAISPEGKFFITQLFSKFHH